MVDGAYALTCLWDGERVRSEEEIAKCTEEARARGHIILDLDPKTFKLPPEDDKR